MQMGAQIQKLKSMRMAHSKTTLKVLQGEIVVLSTILISLVTQMVTNHTILSVKCTMRLLDTSRTWVLQQIITAVGLLLPQMTDSNSFAVPIMARTGGILTCIPAKIAWFLPLMMQIPGAIRGCLVPLG